MLSNLNINMNNCSRLLLLLLPIIWPAYATDDAECGKLIGEFLIVYDASNSFQDDLPYLKRHSPALLNSLASSFPGSKFALATFSDKPIYPLGLYDDYCYKTHIGMTDDQNAIFEELELISIKHGGDSPEAQLDALYHGMTQSSVLWSPISLGSNEEHMLRVIILATDQNYHNASDTTKPPPPDEGYPIDECDRMTYPSVEQISRLMKSRHVIPLFLITEEYISQYQRLLDHIGVGGSVQEITSTSSNLIEAISAGLQSITCFPTPTTTTTPTTTPTTTTTTTPKSVGVGALIGFVGGGLTFVIASGVGGYYAYRSYRTLTPIDAEFAAAKAKRLERDAELKAHIDESYFK